MYGLNQLAWRGTAGIPSAELMVETSYIENHPAEIILNTAVTFKSMRKDTLEPGCTSVVWRRVLHFFLSGHRCEVTGGLRCPGAVLNVYSLERCQHV